MTKLWTPTERFEDGDYLPASVVNNHRDRLNYLYGGQSAHTRLAAVETRPSRNEWQDLPFETVLEDTVGQFSLDQPTEHVVKEDGVYLVGGAVDADYLSAGAAAEGRQFVRLWANHRIIAAIGGYEVDPNNAAGITNNMILTLWPFRAGHKAKLQFYHSSSGNPEIGGLTRLFMARVGQLPLVGDPAWTSPLTWTAAVPTPAQLQTHLSDNMDVLRNGLCARIQSDADQPIATSTATGVELRRKAFGPAAMHVPGSDGLVLPAPGLWAFGSNLQYEALDTGARDIWITKNVSDTVARMSFNPTSVSTGARIACWNIDNFAANDVLRTATQQSAGVSLDLVHIYPYSSHLWACYLGEI